MRYADKLFGVFQRLHGAEGVRRNRRGPRHRAAERQASRRPGLGRAARQTPAPVSNLRCRSRRAPDLTAGSAGHGPRRRDDARAAREPHDNQKLQVISVEDNPDRCGAGGAAT